MKSVAICIATRLRPAGLERTLRGIARQRLPLSSAPRVQVVVVDNDSDGSAASVCQRMQADLPFPLQYCLEPRAGISYARNTAVEAGLAFADAIVFIDDDEVPEPTWLDRLIGAKRRFAADVVCGPVLPYFPSPPPEWVVAARFFDRPRPDTGSLLTEGRSGNVLIARRVFDILGHGFDERFALTGGEDAHFFDCVYRAGLKMVWCDEAVVTEWVPPSRTTVRWLVQREYRSGITFVSMQKPFTSPMQVVSRFGHGLVKMSLGVASTPLCLLGGPRAWVGTLRYAGSGLGMLVGLLGGRHEEYKTVHPV